MLEKYQQLLQRLFDESDRQRKLLSERWRLNANRRTLSILISSGCAAGLLYVFVIMPPSDFPLRTLITVPEGAGVSEIARSLQEQQVIRSPLAFQVLAVVLGHERELHAGDYLFKEPQSIFAVLQALSLGAYGMEPARVRIPEGAMTRTMAVILSKSLLRFNAENFLAQAQPMEGYLFPDTYFFLPNTTEDTVIRTMRQNFDVHIAEFLPDIEASGHTLEEVVTMASMLEREARKTEDRRMIAGVLWNRLERGMALQVDAVFLYILGRATFDLTMEDLTNDVPYNTYTRKGLPPGPIGSPSLDSIKAAIHPTENSYLFYLADNSGVTHYSKTYEEHLRKKRQYLGT